MSPHVSLACSDGVKVRWYEYTFLWKINNEDIRDETREDVVCI